MKICSFFQYMNSCWKSLLWVFTFTNSVENVRAAKSSKWERKLSMALSAPTHCWWKTAIRRKFLMIRDTPPQWKPPKNLIKIKENLKKNQSCQQRLTGSRPKTFSEKEIQSSVSQPWLAQIDNMGMSTVRPFLQLYWIHKNNKDWWRSWEMFINHGELAMWESGVRFLEQQ